MSMKTIITCVAAGVAIGMILAPEKGSTTREKIKETLDDLLDRWQKLKGTTSDELEELKAVFRNEIAGLKEDTRKRVLEILQSAKIAGNHVKHQMAS
ncbi:MAG: YtxH domain-containing protein [Sphingobacteriales bacterium]